MYRADINPSISLSAQLNITSGFTAPVQGLQQTSCSSCNLFKGVTIRYAHSLTGNTDVRMHLLRDLMYFISLSLRFLKELLIKHLQPSPCPSRVCIIIAPPWLLYMAAVAPVWGLQCHSFSMAAVHSGCQLLDRPERACKGMNERAPREVARKLQGTHLQDGACKMVATMQGRKWEIFRICMNQQR